MPIVEVTLKLSGDLAPGSVWEIDSKKMASEVDGSNVLDDIEGNFFDLPPGNSTLGYDDDEVGRDVVVKVTYTPRDA